MTRTKTLIDTVRTLIQEALVILEDVTDKNDIVDKGELNKIRSFTTWLDRGEIHKIKVCDETFVATIIKNPKSLPDQYLTVEFNGYEQVWVSRQNILDGVFTQSNAFKCVDDRNNEILIYSYQLTATQPENNHDLGTNPEPVSTFQPDAGPVDGRGSGSRIVPRVSERDVDGVGSSADGRHHDFDPKGTD